MAGEAIGHVAPIAPREDIQNTSLRSTDHLGTVLKSDKIVKIPIPEKDIEGTIP